MEDFFCVGFAKSYLKTGHNNINIQSTPNKTERSPKFDFDSRIMTNKRFFNVTV